MKKINLLLLLAVMAITFVACSDDDDVNTGIPGEITITETIEGNVVNFHAVAENATAFNWDLGNGQTPTGADVQGTYSFPGDYVIKCTAVGREENTVATKTVNVQEGDPEIFSEINLLLSGYNATTGESETTWIWAQGDWNMSCGGMSYGYDTCYFNVIDESWWHSTGDEAADESVYDDEYTFKLNPQMEYVNNFGTAFMINWMYAAVNFSLMPAIWGDVAYENYEAPAASWNVEFYPSGSLADTLNFQTVIGNKTYEGALVIHLTNNAYLGYAAAGHDYQICSYIDNVLLIRYDNSRPIDIYDYNFDPASGTLEENGITAGEKEWDYIRLVKKQ